MSDSSGNLRHEGKVFFIPGGAGRGIGAATSFRFAKDGATAIILDLDGHRGQELVLAIQADAGNARFYHGDAADAVTVNHVVREVCDEYGRIDGLVHVAGGACPEDGNVLQLAHKIETMLMESYRTNALSAAICTQAVLPQMLKRRHGKILYLSSLSATHGFFARSQVGYAMAKAGTHILARACSALFASYGLRFYPVVLCTVPNDKPSWEERRREMPELESALDRIYHGGLGCPQSVADALCALCSDDFQMATGAEVWLDSGWEAAGGPAGGPDFDTVACVLHNTGALDRLFELQDAAVDRAIAGLAAIPETPDSTAETYRGAGKG